MKNYLTEFIGTFFLVLTIGLTAVLNTPYAPLAIGCALMVMVYMGGHISGAHYNPAVSLAVYLRGKLDAKDFVPYMVSQIVGAIAAAYIVSLASPSFAKTFAPDLGTNVTIGQGLLIEVLFTFALALVVLNVATAAKTAGNSFYGLAIGFTVMAGAYAGGPISGGAFNPAVGIGPALIRWLLIDGSLTNMWIHIVGPFAGAFLAALVFRVQEEEKPASMGTN